MRQIHIFVKTFEMIFIYLCGQICNVCFHEVKGWGGGDYLGRVVYHMQPRGINVGGIMMAWTN